MDPIHYRGAYRYADATALAEAFNRALKEHVDWVPRFVVVGASLRVDLDLPARERIEAAHVMQTLAHLAIEGIVVARQRDLAVDVFTPRRT